MMEASPERFAHLEDELETCDYTGHVGRAIDDDADVMRFSGQTLIGGNVGRHFGLTDIAGKLLRSVRESTGAAPSQDATYKAN